MCEYVYICKHICVASLTAAKRQTSPALFGHEELHVDEQMLSLGVTHECLDFGKDWILTVKQNIDIPRT